MIRAIEFPADPRCVSRQHIAIIVTVSNYRRYALKRRYGTCVLFSDMARVMQYVGYLLWPK